MPDRLSKPTGIAIFNMHSLQKGKFSFFNRKLEFDYVFFFPLPYFSRIFASEISARRNFKTLCWSYPCQATLAIVVANKRARTPRQGVVDIYQVRHSGPAGREFLSFLQSWNLTARNLPPSRFMITSTFLFFKTCVQASTLFVWDAIGSVNNAAWNDFLELVVVHWKPSIATIIWSAIGKTRGGFVVGDSNASTGNIVTRPRQLLSPASSVYLYNRADRIHFYNTQLRSSWKRFARSHSFLSLESFFSIWSSDRERREGMEIIPPDCL